MRRKGRREAREIWKLVPLQLLVGADIVVNRHISRALYLQEGFLMSRSAVGK